MKAFEDIYASKAQNTLSLIQGRTTEPQSNAQGTVPSHPKPMKWTTFVKFMVGKGFTVKVATSSVTFAPPNPNFIPITVHKPHPDPILTPMMLSSIADTLENSYGWNAGNFVKRANAAIAAEARVTNVKTLEGAPISKLQRSELSAEAKEFLNCGMDPGTQPKPVKWSTFIRVMGELGFESHDTTGSSVRFDHANPTAHPITIHKPHPDSTLTPIMVLKIVKRLRRYYGPNQEVLFSDTANTVAGSSTNPAALEENQTPAPSSPEEPSTAKYTWFSRLSKQATDSMHQLLRTGEDAGKQPAPMKWDTFVRLMREMGFEHNPNTSGSAARFEPPNSKDHPISIHKPHPDSTLTPIMLIKIAKRLKKYYNWNEDDFVAQTRAALASEKFDNGRENTPEDTARQTQSKHDAKIHYLPMKWDTFVEFMVRKGFQYDPSTAGSSVRFDPSNLSDNAISVHKPHPDSTLTPIMLVKIAKRMKKLYGWTEEGFAAEANTAVLATGSTSPEAREDTFASSDAFQKSLVQWLTVGAGFDTASKTNVSYVPSGLKWETFVTLMTGMGFEVDQTYSAGVRFMPPNVNDPPITLHRPQPDDILTPMMLIKIGKRLQRYYNWDEEDFATQANNAAAIDLEGRE